MKHTQPIALLGPAYSHSHLCCMKTSPDCRVLFCTTITEVFQKVAQKKVKQGWVALKNTLQGEVQETAKALQNFSVAIVKIYNFPIHHCLASQTKNFRIIASHPQALTQCSQVLSQYSAPSYSVIETENTSSAMQLAAENPEYAAIGSFEAAKQYGLKVFRNNTENDPKNATQFGVIELKEKGE